MKKDQLENPDFAQFRPFSVNSNKLYFDNIAPILLEDLLNGSATSTLRSHFEELLVESESLQNDYVELYGSDNEFHCIQKNYDGEVYDVYFATNKSQVVLFFWRISN